MFHHDQSHVKDLAYSSLAHIRLEKAVYTTMSTLASTPLVYNPRFTRTPDTMFPETLFWPSLLLGYSSFQNIHLGSSHNAAGPDADTMP
jgi:hypothetical protein